MVRKITGWMVLAAAVLALCSQAWAQSSPMANCRYYVKNQQDYAQGLPYCREAIAENPEDPEARFYGAVCLAENGHLAEAWESFSWLAERTKDKDKNVRKLAEKGEKQAQYYWQREFKKGVELVESGDFQAAHDAFRNATEVYPSRVDAYLNLGYTQIQLESLDGAIGSFRTAIEIDPKNKTAHEYLWDALTRKLEVLLQASPQDQEAIAAIRAELRTVLLAVVEMDGSKHEPYLDLADLALAQNDVDTALGYFRKATEIAPEAVYRIYNIGGKFYQTDQYGPAIEAFKIFLDTVNDPDDPNWQQAFAVLAWCYYYNENYEQAVPHLEKVIEMRPDEKDNYAKLGLALSKLGQKDKASEYLMRYEEMREKEIVGE